MLPVSISSLWRNFTRWPHVWVRSSCKVVTLNSNFGFHIEIHTFMVTSPKHVSVQQSIAISSSASIGYYQYFSSSITVEVKKRVCFCSICDFVENRENLESRECSEFRCSKMLNSKTPNSFRTSLEIN